MYKTIFTFALLLTAATTATAQSPATGQRLGHDYVDLGLSVMWATCNIGASSPSDYGDYFAWGEAETKSTYTENNSTTQGKSSYTFLDAASAQWGSAWRMPTSKECKELIYGCKWQRTTIGGHEGLLGTGPNGNTIFFPVTGMYGTSLDYINEGTYWTSTPDCSSSNNYANCIHISRDLEIEVLGYIRFAGRCIRPVTKLNEQEKSELSIGQILGHNYVDLGLSVKWAACNIGAESPSDYGDYFAWGEDVTKSTYTKKNSATYRKTNYTFHDAAKKKWGGTWRMPTKDEFRELIVSCTWTKTTLGSHKGYEVIGPNGNSIFLPAAGYRCKSSLLYIGLEGSFYWCSTPVDYSDSNQWHFDNKSLSCFALRFYGLPIRPVSE